ncbi:RAD51 associated protein 2 [Willisornis vidua]|uniref:RAD51 associated protein 2 n=1 Tax=Willisornis vidua TaxID=1566151 RepID=A0ABQ9DHR6_9PASS|nr:RAD51 associated protein 2 [Willisornis vidua]
MSKSTEKNNSPIKKPEHSNLAEKEVSGTYFRGDSTDIECNKIFAENDLEDKMLENSAGDDDQKSKMLIYISAKNVQNEKCVSCNDLLQRVGRKSSNENAGTFHVQTSIPVTTEALEENKLDLHCDVHNSNSNISLYEVEPKLSTKEILDFQRYAIKSIVSERNCSCIIVQNFPDKRVSRNVYREKELFKSKFSFQNILFGLIRTWTESFHEDLSTDEVTNSEVTYTMKEYVGACSYVNADGEERANSKELQINYPNIFSKKSYSIFDTYEKIHLPTDSEDFDQIPALNQDSSMKKELYEESAVIGPKEVHCLPVKSNDVSMLLEQSKATTEKYNSLLPLDRQTKKHEYCKELCTYSPHLANKKVEDQNTYLNSENLLPSSSDVCQSVTLSLGSSSLVDRGVSGDGHGRSSSSAGKLKESETIPAMVQYPSRGRPSMTDTYLQLQAKETVQFSLQGQERTNKMGSLEPATLKELPEYVKEQEERSDEQMHVTNESQCETVMKDLIMSHSEDESQTFIAGEEELKMHLSVMNNGCLEDVKDKYLPLENKLTHEFELKRKFDLVLEELHMFHKISNENENNLSSLETNSLDNYWELNNSEEIDENVTSVSQKKICISSPIRGTIEKQNITDSNENSLNEEILNEKKDQEVSKEYFISRLSSEVLLYSPVAEGYFLSRDIIRVQPLKTCKGPIRIGLSRRARPKQLHPYLK